MKISGMNKKEHGARFVQYWIHEYSKRNKPLQRIAAAIRSIERFFQREGLLCEDENIHSLCCQEVNWQDREIEVDDDRLKNLSAYECEVFETAKYQTRCLNEYGVSESLYSDQNNYLESSEILVRILNGEYPPLPECDSFLWSSRAGLLIRDAVEHDGNIRLRIGNDYINSFHYLIALNLDATEQEIVTWVRNLIKMHRIQENIQDEESLCKSEQDFVMVNRLRSESWKKYDDISYEQKYSEFLAERNSKSIKTLWLDRAISLHMYDYKEKFGGSAPEVASKIYYSFELYKHDYDLPEYDTKAGQSGKRRFERLLKCAEESIRLCELVPFSG